MHGTYCVLEAARQANVERVILASSNHAAGFHQKASAADEVLPADAPARPDTYYGWSKAAIESLGRLYADRFGMDVICLRIGTCKERPLNKRALSTWLSFDDAARLIKACLAADRPGFRIVWGVSANRRGWLSLDEGRALGYEPVDDAEAFVDSIQDGHVATTGPELLGGEFCSVPLGVPPGE